MRVLALCLVSHQCSDVSLDRLHHTSHITLPFNSRQPGSRGSPLAHTPPTSSNKELQRLMKLGFTRAGRPSISVKALSSGLTNHRTHNGTNQWPDLIISSPITGLTMELTSGLTSSFLHQSQDSNGTNQWPDLIISSPIRGLQWN